MLTHFSGHAKQSLLISNNYLLWMFLVCSLLLLAACGSSSSVPPRTGTSGGSTLPSENGYSEIEPPYGPGGMALGPGFHEGSAYRVAVLLPLSGQHASIGKSLVNGIQMALLESRERADLPVELIFEDTVGTPQGAAEAAQRVVAQGAELIIGPLFSSSARSVAQVTGFSGIPVITFSSDPNAAGGNVFVFGITPKEQMRRLILYSRQQGKGRFAVLAPATPFGQAIISATQELVPTYGGQLSATMLYGPDQQTQSEQVREIANLSENYDALILAADGQELLIIAPLLLFHDINVDAVQILGTMEWLDPQLASESALDGAWFPATPPAAQQTFEAQYQSLFRGAPHPLASLGYDATAMIVALVARAQQRGEAGLPAFTSESLLDEQGFAGYNGLFRLLPSGEVERILSVMEFQNGAIIERAPTPQSFEVLAF